MEQRRIRLQRSLLSKTVLWVSIGITLIVFLIIFVTTGDFTSDRLQEERAATDLYARIILHHFENRCAQHPDGTLEELSEELELNQADLPLDAWVFDLQGKVVKSSGREQLPHGGSAFLGETLGRGEGRWRVQPDPDGADRLHMSYFIRDERGKPLGVVYLFHRLEELRTAHSARLIRTMGFLLLILLFVGAVTMLTIYRFVLRPISAMIEANVALFEGREQGAMIPEERIPDDELGDIMRTRNIIYHRMLKYQKRLNAKNIQLEAQSRELDHWSRELERRVEEKSRELARAHRRLVEAEKLAAMGRLAAGIAHEINNPLASIAGYAEDLRELAAQSELKGQPAFTEFPQGLKVIEEQAFRCKKITRALLNFARQSEITLVPVPLNELLADTLHLVDHKARRAGVQLASELDPAIETIETDLIHLQQVVVNLLGNAIDASERGTEVCLRTGTEDHRVIIEVADQGKGIPEEHRHRIFDPFFTTKPVGEGTGLGLAICYGIVSKLGGRIDFTSEVGKGTTFTITLPLPDHPPQPGAGDFIDDDSSAWKPVARAEA